MSDALRWWRDGGIRVWVAEVSDRAAAQLEGVERQRFEAIQNEAVAACYATTRVMVRELCGWVLKVPAKGLRIAVTPGGKPFLPDFADLHFSVSHTGRRVAVALSAGAVGVDIEEVGRRVAVGAIAHRVLSVEERGRMGEGSTEQFLKIWVAKEAVLKCCGEGISGNLPSCECQFDDDKVVGAEFRGEKYGVSPLVHVTGLVGAVAAREAHWGPVEVVWWQDWLMETA